MSIGQQTIGQKKKQKISHVRTPRSFMHAMQGKALAYISVKFLKGVHSSSFQGKYFPACVRACVRAGLVFLPLLIYIYIYIYRLIYQGLILTAERLWAPIAPWRASWWADRSTPYLDDSSLLGLLDGLLHHWLLVTLFRLVVHLLQKVINNTIK